MRKIGILGSAAVGQTLARGFRTHGHAVRLGSRTPGKLADFSTSTGIPIGTFAEAAADADIVVLAVRGSAAEDALRLAGEANLAGKVVIDTTNPISDAPPVDGVLQFFTGPNSSLMEQLQSAFPAARFVKAFNSVGNARMVNPVFKRGRPSMFFCGNDEQAKTDVAAILDEFGWEPVDLGTAAAARAIEPLCQLWCIPGFRQNRWAHAFAVFWD
ncbi:MAG: NAD(P)-binding domain-containing protein [Acidobacteria bacterium]|nr:NAD(P)-binding domain-containing protein [Acidobacteriota bacterium]